MNILNQSFELDNSFTESISTNNETHMDLLQISISRSEWQSIYELNSDKLINNWSNLLHDRLLETHGCCPHRFRRNIIKKEGSRKKAGNFFWARGECLYDNCNREYLYYIGSKPCDQQETILINVRVSGEFLHNEKVIKRR